MLPESTSLLIIAKGRRHQDVRRFASQEEEQEQEQEEEPAARAREEGAL